MNSFPIKGRLQIADDGLQKAEGEKEWLSVIRDQMTDGRRQWVKRGNDQEPGHRTLEPLNPKPSKIILILFILVALLDDFIVTYNQGNSS